MVASHNYTWQQGEDLVLSMLYKQGPVGAEVPVDLSGHSLRMDIVGADGVRRYTFNSDEVTDVDPTNAEPNEPDVVEEAVLGSDGSITITVPRTLTLPGGEVYDDITGSTPPTFQYDVFLRDPSNLQKKILKGTITVEKSHTLWA